MGATSASSWPAVSNCCAGADAGCAGGGVCAKTACDATHNKATASSLMVSLNMIASRHSPQLHRRFLTLYSFVLYLLSHRLAQYRNCDFRGAGAAPCAGDASDA